MGLGLSGVKLVCPRSWDLARIHFNQRLARFDAHEDDFRLVIIYLSRPPYSNLNTVFLSAALAVLTGMIVSADGKERWGGVMTSEA